MLICFAECINGFKSGAYTNEKSLWTLICIMKRNPLSNVVADYVNFIQGIYKENILIL